MIGSPELAYATLLPGRRRKALLPSSSKSSTCGHTLGTAPSLRYERRESAPGAARLRPEVETQNTRTFLSCERISLDRIELSYGRNAKG